MNRISKFFYKVEMTARIALRPSAKEISTVQSAWTTTKPEYPQTNFKNNVIHGWRKNELIFACLKAKGNTGSQLGIKLRNKRSQKEIEDHPLLDLLRKPNSYMDEFDLWTSVILYQHLAGRAIFEIRFNRGGIPIELHPLRPDWITPHSSGNDFIARYEYKVPGEGRSAFLDPHEVLDMVLFDPLDLYNGYPPISIAGRSGDIDNAQTDYLKRYFDEGGVPPGLLKTDQKMNKSKIDEILDLWRERYAGYRDWQTPMVLGQGYEYQKVGSLISEMGIEIVDARGEARICGILQVPPIIVGAKVGLDRSTFANYKEARQSWWEDTIRPMYQDFLSGVNAQLTRYYEEDLELFFDFSEVPAFQEDETAKYSRADIGVKGGWMTVNEARELVGLDPLKKGVGDVFLRGFSMIEVPITELRTSVVEPNPVTPLLGDGNDEEDDNQDNTDEDQAPTENAPEDADQGSKAKGTKAQVQPFEDEFDQGRRDLEKDLSFGLIDYFADLGNRIEAELKDNFGDR